MPTIDKLRRWVTGLEQRAQQSEADFERAEAFRRSIVALDRFVAQADKRARPVSPMKFEAIVVPPDGLDYFRNMKTR